MAPPIFPRAVVARLRAGARSFLDANGDLLRRRVREGRIREGHGDLHAGNICFTAGDVVIYDRIEFSRPFRCRDVAGEIAFLAMDLDLRSFRGFARSLVHRSAGLAGDADLVRLVDFYKSHWAAVRAMVAALRSRAPELDGPAREDARREALRYLALAASYVLPRALILTCGLPGTGKSRAARAVARPFEAAILRSDVVRKELAGLAPTARASDEVYAPDVTRRTYDALLARAREQLRRGRTVIVDATFASAALRRPFLALAEECAAPLVVLELRAADEIVRRRLARRRHDAREASDADVRVYEEARARFEPPREVPPGRVVLVEGDFADEDVAVAVVERLCDGPGADASAPQSG
jgi:predicted kinase